MARSASNGNYNRVKESKTVDVLRQIFGRFGVPKQIVSDNGPQFTSEQFQAFLGIMVYSTKHQYHGTLLQMA